MKSEITLVSALLFCVALCALFTPFFLVLSSAKRNTPWAPLVVFLALALGIGAIAAWWVLHEAKRLFRVWCATCGHPVGLEEAKFCRTCGVVLISPSAESRLETLKRRSEEAIAKLEKRFEPVFACVSELRREQPYSLREKAKTSLRFTPTDKGFFKNIWQVEILQDGQPVATREIKTGFSECTEIVTLLERWGKWPSNLPVEFGQPRA